MELKGRLGRVEEESRIEMEDATEGLRLKIEELQVMIAPGDLGADMSDSMTRSPSSLKQ